MVHYRQIFALHTIFRKFGTKSPIIKSKIEPIIIPKIGLPEFLWSKQEKWFNRVAIESFETGHSYTYYELYKKSLSLSLFMRKNLKLKAQDTVAIVLNNIPEYPIAVLGAINAGLRVTTCNPISTIDEIKRQFQDSQPKLVITSDEVLAKIRKTVPIIEISEKELHTGSISFKEATTKETDKPNLEIALNDTLMLLHSSGTTGLPKNIELTSSNLLSNLCQFTNQKIELIEPLDGGKQEVVPVFLPFSHIYGIVGLMLNGLVQGAKLLTMSKFSSGSFIDMLKAHKPTVLFCTPPQVLLMIKNDNIKPENLTNLRCVYSGAAPLKATDVQHFSEKTAGKVDILQLYGLTECSPLLTGQTKKVQNGVKIGGSGFLLANTLARIVDVATRNNLGPNQPGELEVKGPQVMKGYLNNPKANREIFTEDGWLKTGDIAQYDHDQHFFITDRLKELIKVKGFQVAPAELEGILREHPSVEDAAVVGVPHHINGEAPKAFVVCSKQKKVNGEELKEFVAGKVSPYKHLTGGVVFVEIIPKTPSGKILRRNVLELQ